MIDVSARTLVAIAALSCVVAGCGSSRPSSSAGAPGSAESAATTKPSAAKHIDACSMIAPQEISSLLGAPATGVSTGKDPTQADCTWTNSATDESISLTISNPGTALNNKLPPEEAGFPDPTTPGPDGMRYMGGGVVEFAAGNRVNTVQVAVLRMSSDEANAAAVKLAHEIAPQVPQ
jgi:hypothetical protein